MYKSLEIENFRGLRHLELPRLAPITILTGRNNVGKTAALEALFVHASGSRAALQLLTSLRPHRTGGPFLNIELSKHSSPWETAFHNKDMNNSIHLKAGLENEKISVVLSSLRQDFAIQISPPLQAESTGGASTSETVPGVSHALHIVINSTGSDPSSHREYTQTISAGQVSPVISSIPGFQFTGGLNFNIQLQPEDNAGPLVSAYFISAQDRSPHAELAKRYSNLRLRGRDQEFLSAMRAVEPSLKAIEILATGTPTLYFTLEGGPPLPIATMGEGMTSVANYAAAIFETTGGVVLIDEVENGIHYSVLEKVWTQIGRAAKESGTQIVASTHSYECVRAAYRAFRDDPGFLQLIRLESGDGSPAAIEAADYDLDTLKSAIDMNLDVR